MSRPILTAAETRAAEQALFDSGVTVEALMARAGRAVADRAWDRFGPVPALVACGPGNNGGDGYVVAQRLRQRGVAVRVCASAPPTSPAAQAARAAWEGPVEPLAEAAPAPLFFDALFGTGLTRPLDEAVAAPARALAAAARHRVAIDLPSGIASDDGAVLSTPPAADLCVALGALKRAHRLMPGLAACGEVVLAEIGLDAASSVVEIEPPRLAAPGVESDKYKRGKLLVAAGAMPGAALLAALAGQRAGAGYVELLGLSGDAPPHALVRRAWDDAALEDRRIGAIVIGPGLGTESEGARRLARVLAGDRPLVLDADALTLIARQGPATLRGRAAPSVLTPHMGEFARLFPDATGSALDKARHGAAATGAVLLLKGACTVVAHPDGRAAINPPAPAWLASAGTGDVLAGTIGALLAQRSDGFAAAQAGAWLHAEAARLAGPLLIADDLLAGLRAAARACL
ncbi:NAD(P)H-hydrate dehydratase [Sphingomonas morindae]|uniref:Bifunctional NAD(P)H-hydrate repair enzyme n=1 Tax=Sphingomonas morindae TaxID=1541170 RepID=A0ABY4X4W7_9SPHN|nr:NAD(P)H-hydrate dehydratase [Sphingomonas morindae]USI71882.1 NAD(P)H-hydrate dehydratase [Sphingomonas morindae]